MTTFQAKHRVEYQGKTYTLREIADKTGYGHDYIWKKFKRFQAKEVPIEFLFKMKSVFRAKYKIKYKNKTYTLREIAEQTGFSIAYICRKFRQLQKKEITIEFLFEAKPEHKKVVISKKQEIEYDGKTYSLQEIAKKTGWSQRVINRKFRYYKKGESYLKELFYPRFYIDDTGHTWTAEEISRESGVSLNTAKKRLKQAKRENHSVAQMTRPKNKFIKRKNIGKREILSATYKDRLHIADDALKKQNEYIAKGWI